MIVLLVNIVLLLLTLTGMWFGGVLLKFDLKLVIAAMVGVALIWIIIYLILRMLNIRRSTHIAESLKGASAGAAPPGASPQQIAAMREQFDRYLQALRASPSGRASLATLPWYLVIGAPGSGKTTALQESGLAFSSMGHGLRSVRGIGGTRNCDWWFTDQAILLDTAGRYTTQPEDQGEWFSFLDLIRQTRKGRALNGVMVLVSTAELLKTHEAGIPAMVRPIRERIAEVSARLRLVLPVYVVFSKADLIGGFKDFFSGMTRAERDQVWGATLAPAELAGRQPSDVFHQRMGELFASIQAYRIQALALERPFAQRAKICMFPQNFIATQKRLGEFISELFRPSPDPDQPVLRGFYLTSGIQNTKLAEPAQTAAAAALAGPPLTGNMPLAPMAKETMRPGTEMSIFFDNDAALQQAQAPIDQRNGFFLKDLFTRVIIPDHSLAGLPARLVARAQWLRLFTITVALVIGVGATFVLVSHYLANRQLINPALAAEDMAHKAEALDDKNPASGKAQLEALINLSRIRTLIRETGHGSAAQTLGSALDTVYAGLVNRLLVAPAAAEIRTRMVALRDQSNKTPQLYDELYDLYRCYQMLANSPPLDGQALPQIEQQRLERVLTDKPYWTVRLPAGDEKVAKQARDQLDYLIKRMPTLTGWANHLDDTLAKDITTALSDVMWLQNSYADLLAGAQASGDLIGREALLSGPNSELLTSDYQFSPVFTKDGWGRMKAAIDEKANLLVERYQNLKNSNQNVDKVRRALRAQYAREYSTHWLHLLASLRPKPFASISEAATRLPLLIGGDSPYKGLLKQMGAANNSDLEDVDSAIQLPSDGKWLQDGLAATVELQVALQRYSNTTEANSRLRDLPKLKDLCASADAVAAKYASLTQSIDNDSVRSAAASCLGNILIAVQNAVGSELGSEVDTLWDKRFYTPFKDRCAGHFPFDMDAATDTDLVTFAKLFNPKNGALNAVQQTVQELSTYHFAGKDIFTLSWDYQRLLTQLPTLNDALFASSGEKVAINFAVILQQREGEKDINIAVGAQSFGLWQRPDRRSLFEWNQDNGAGAKLTIQLATGQWLTHDYPSPGWGILRMMREGKPTTYPEGGHQCTWNFEDKALGRTFVANLILQAPALETLVAGDYFRTLLVPARISR